MKRSLILIALACGSVSLAGCVRDYGGYEADVGWRSYPYSVWYDNHYGRLYDGYWGTDGFFYFRLFVNDRNYRRAAPGHVFRDRPPQRRDDFRRYDGHSRRPPTGTDMPYYPGPGDRDRDRDRDDRR